MLQGRTLKGPAGKAASLLNLLLVVLMAAVIGSGIMLSNYLFKDLLPLAWRVSITAQQVHKSLCFALWLVTGLHLGLHLPALLHRRLQSAAGRRLAVGAALLLSALGIYGAFLHRIGDRLLLKHIFATPALKGGPVVYLGGLLAVFCLYMTAGWLVQWLCTGRKDKKNEG